MDDTALPFYVNGTKFYAGPITLAYCMDGYNEIQETVTSYNSRVDRIKRIKNEAEKYIPIHFSVDIAINSKGILSVGLGETESVIVWYNSTDDVYLTSLGDEQAIGSKLYYFGDWSDMSNKYAISWEAALLVIKVWIKTGDIGNCIKWTSIIY